SPPPSPGPGRTSSAQAAGPVTSPPLASPSAKHPARIAPAGSGRTSKRPKPHHGVVRRVLSSIASFFAHLL
ncbi:MAG: hypothetical protein ACRDJU_14590, partial [Actinomycetota bacterium]